MWISLARADQTDRLTCESCLKRSPVALAPFIIRWGAGVSSDMLRNSARCSHCGRKGASLQHPGWGGAAIGIQPFPVSEG